MGATTELMFSAKHLLFLAFVAWISADPPAAPTMAQMVARIKAGRADNNFFTGHMIEGTSSVEQKVGSCFLDKVGAIINEHGIQKFANDLKVDLSSCCTKGSATQQTACVKQLSPAYAAIVSKNQAGALKVIVAAAKERLKGAALLPNAAKLLKMGESTIGASTELVQLDDDDEDEDEEDWN